MIKCKYKVVKQFVGVKSEPFAIQVDSMDKVFMLYEILTSYDLYQYDNNIKPEREVITLVQMWNEEDQEWREWYDEDFDMFNFDEYYKACKERE